MRYKTNNPYELKKLEAARKKQKKMLITAGSIVIAIAIIVTAILVFPKLGAKDITAPGSSNEPNNPDYPHVLITMEDGGEIELELDRTAAPITVENFITLAASGFYDGLTFHRVSPIFMIQGGDGTGAGKTASAITGEFSSNGVDNPLKHTRGTISMARVAGQPDSATSQFFIMTGDSEFLDGDYAAFGHVVRGMGVVDKIGNEEGTPFDESTVRPYNPPVIKSIVVL